jgi:hypothetical protein
MSVQIAHCPEHGLHGARDTCFECGGPVEQITMLPVSDVEKLSPGADDVLVFRTANDILPEQAASLFEWCRTNHLRAVLINQAEDTVTIGDSDGLRLLNEVGEWLNEHDAWYAVKPPWGDGTFVIEGNPDPHVGTFLADCEDQANPLEGDADLETSEARNRAAAIEEAHAFVIKLRDVLTQLLSYPKYATGMELPIPEESP